MQNNSIVDWILNTPLTFCPCLSQLQRELTCFPQRKDIRIVLKFPRAIWLPQIFKVLTLTVFHTRLLFPLTTATFATSYLTCTCNYKVFWHLTKVLILNKPAVEELPAKINYLQFWFVGVKDIEANVYEVVSSQQVSFNCWGCRS